MRKKLWVVQVRPKKDMVIKKFHGDQRNPIVVAGGAAMLIEEEAEDVVRVFGIF